MKRPILTVTGALIGLYLLVLGTHVTVAAIHAKSYISSLSGEYNRASLDKQAGNLAADLNRIFSDLNVPVVKQIASALGVDFTPIRDEVIATVKASSWLAGADAPKRYMIAFQNSAEARGTGGILGAFAIVEISKGHLAVIRTGSNAILKSLEELPIRMPSDYIKLYGSDPAIWQNSNISPHFPYAAQIWMALWKNQFGEQLDGVIAVDPSALSYVLQATGPITLKSGEVIKSENVVAETLQKAYKRYETNNDARKQYLVDIMNATAIKLTTGQYSKIGMARALQQGIVENRILVYSTERSVEQELKKTRMAGFMQTTSSNQFRVVVQNIDASKLDYYLKRDTSIQSVGCGVSAQVEVSVVVKNTLKSGNGLPAYVLTRADKSKPKTIIAGQHRFLLFVYGPPKSKLIQAIRSSTSGPAGGVATERKRPILVTNIDLAPGKSERVTATFTRGQGALEYQSQPLALKESVYVNDKCA
jgi:hypothetical protein